MQIQDPDRHINDAEPLDIQKLIEASNEGALVDVFEATPEIVEVKNTFAKEQNELMEKMHQEINDMFNIGHLLNNKE